LLSYIVVQVILVTARRSVLFDVVAVLESVVNKRKATGEKMSTICELDIETRTGTIRSDRTEAQRSGQRVVILKRRAFVK
jgi:hypothetical protein